MSYSICYEPIPKLEDTLYLTEQISQEAKKAKNMTPIESFGFFIKDENNEILAGCSAVMFYGCLYVDQLWVSEKLRHKGHGTQLMLLAENLAKEKGCTFSTVNTMDWEALNFYKKLGYQVELERKGYCKNSIFYFLRKDF